MTVYAQPGGSAVSQVDGTFTLTGIPRGDVELGTWPHVGKAPQKLVVNASVLALRQWDYVLRNKRNHLRRRLVARMI